MYKTGEEKRSRNSKNKGDCQEEFRGGIQSLEPTPNIQLYFFYTFLLYI